MKTRIADENPDAADLLPHNEPDGSGIGVNHADAFIKPLNTELDDGRRIVCKRKGLQITLTIGEAKGSALMDKFNYGPGEQDILIKALESAAAEAGSSFSVEDGGLYLDV